MNYSFIPIFFLAIRPKTLFASFAPVFLGTAMAFGDGVHDLPTAGFCLAGALLIQIGTNLANDYFDFKKGADTQARVGPVRVTQAGLVTPLAMKVAIGITFLLAWGIALWLFKRGGWPIIAIGAASILSGLLYTAGPLPLGYLGLGEIFVLIFFGPVAVAGTYYVQSLEMSPAVILAGLAPGFFATGILVVNNLRDIEGDKISGKRTLAVRFGADFARGEYLFVMLCAALMPIVIYFLTRDHVYTLVSCFIALVSIPAIHTVLTKSDGPSLNAALTETGRLLLFYSILFSVGWVL
ncbi:MAG: 1,4-dihydroxy-2-naphthoate octaprenyltransferase [Omnitrophica WOR_2 bacterium GWA2_47_8]|nr:MAG: 1,4-dihydroxy-2-naphthoate octaprenyltransferase [Omnitrophica WOR_2 bacterium GWA2_47_8]